MFFALLAMLPLPWIICGEIFPMSIKGSYTWNNLSETC
jgi:SP family facilitated glucose transporter-like MFS transporter 8